MNGRSLGSTKKSIMGAATSQVESDSSDILRSSAPLVKEEVSKTEINEKPKPKFDENAENLIWLENGSVEFNGVFRTTRRSGMQYRHHNFLVPLSLDKKLKRFVIDSELTMNELANLLFIDLIEKGQLPPKLLKQYKKETGKK